MFDKEDKVAFLEALINNLPGHIYWKDKNGVLQGCNKEQAKSIGLNSPAEIKGLTAYDTLPKELADKVTLNDREVMASGVAQNFEESYILPNNKISIWHSEKKPITTKLGEVIGILGISFDITAQKQLAEKEKEVLKKQVELSEMIGATVAHEVRTPLGAVQMATSVIKEALEMGDLQQVEKSCQEIRRHLQRANDFIESFLMNVKHQQSVSTDEIASMQTTLATVLDNYAYVTPTDKGLITIDEDFTDFDYACNQALIEHVLANLLKNALFFIKRAGKGRIHIGYSDEAEFNCLQFKDTGFGVAPEKIERVFDKFYTSTEVGSGVGLSFCKMILESIGGKITCTSEFGEFTEFKLYFPKII